MRFGFCCVMVLFTGFMTQVFGQEDTTSMFYQSEDEWVDSIYNSLTLDKKIGQLFMIRAYSKSDNADVKQIVNNIERYEIGGLCFFQGSPVRQVQLINDYQKKSKIPLLISIDAEWGAGMRFPGNALSFPRQLTLGAIQDNNLIYDMGKEIGRHCQKMGVHVNFAPVVDINSNPDNPVINDRSFGEDKYNVAAKAYAYTKGLQEEGIIASAKHFPGHGDTDTDSHLDLPTIKHNAQRLNDIELFPFKALSAQGVESVMVAHLNITAWMDEENRPSSLSKKIVTDILKEEIGFEGLVFTDALDMKGVTKNFEKGVAAAEAFEAGVDVLLLPESIELSLKAIKSRLNEGSITLEQLEKSVKKILAAKYRAGLYNRMRLSDKNVLDYLNRNEAIGLKTNLIEKAVTLANDDEDLIPILYNEEEQTLSISLGSSEQTIFQGRLSQMGIKSHINLSKNFSEGVKNSALTRAKKFKKVIVAVHGMQKSSGKNYGLSADELNFIRELNLQNKTILCLFGSPYALKKFEDMGTVLVMYEDGEIFQDIAAQSILGVNTIEGKLPVEVSEKYHLGSGVVKASLGRLGYSIPERVGMNSKELQKIDGVVKELIAKRAAPGCQVLVAKDGKIVWDKSYGHTMYDKKNKINSSFIYDVASLTKILATTLAVMKLQDEHKMSVSSPLNNYLSHIDTCNKSGMIVKDIMSHVARLKPWIPFYTSTLEEVGKRKVLNKDLYSKHLRPEYNIPVAKNMFLRRDYRDSIWNKIYASELRESSSYRYSDLGFYMLYKCVEMVTGRNFDEYLEADIYQKLGLHNTVFKPLEKFPLAKIAPTERDGYWRNQIVHGTVHDMGAAMLGGVCGHAGIFSNTHDIAIIYQMLLNGGTYGGEQIISNETIQQFTQRHENSTRRGIGFDMKELDTLKNMNMSELASDATFGHTGFTGTAAFADPESNLIYIFISNRTFPSMNNNKLNRNDYRPKIQSILYKSIENHS